MILNDNKQEKFETPNMAQQYSSANHQSIHYITKLLESNNVIYVINNYYIFCDHLVTLVTIFIYLNIHRSWIQHSFSRISQFKFRCHATYTWF